MPIEILARKMSSSEVSANVLTFFAMIPKRFVKKIGIRGRIIHSPTINCIFSQCAEKITQLGNIMIINHPKNPSLNYNLVTKRNIYYQPISD